MRVGLIEVGHWHAGIYIKTLKEKGLEIVAMSDRDINSAKDKGSKLRCKYYNDYRELIRKEKLDFVFSFGRHFEMAEIIETVLDKEISICTEKPITNKSKVMKKLASKALERKLFTDVMLPLRFSPFILAMEEFKKREDIGEIIHCYFRNMAGPIQRYIDWGNSWMIEKEYALGGSFMNEGPHYIDLFRYLTGEDVTSVYADMNNSIYGRNIEDNFSCILETGSRKRAVIEICYG